MSTWGPVRVAGLKLYLVLASKCCRPAALGFKVLPKSAQRRRKEPNIKTFWLIIFWSKTAETGKKLTKNTGVDVLRSEIVKITTNFTKKWWFATFSLKLRLNSWKTGQNKLYSRKKNRQHFGITSNISCWFFQSAAYTWAYSVFLECSTICRAN